MIELIVSQVRNTFYRQEKAKQYINKSKHFLLQQIFIFRNLKWGLKSFDKSTLLPQSFFFSCPLIPLLLIIFSLFILKSGTAIWLLCLILTGLSLWTYLNQNSGSSPNTMPLCTQWHFLKAFPNGKDGFSYLQTHNKERFLTKLHYIINTFSTVQAKNKTLFNKILNAFLLTLSLFGPTVYTIKKPTKFKFSRFHMVFSVRGLSTIISEESGWYTVHSPSSTQFSSIW